MKIRKPFKFYKKRVEILLPRRKEDKLVKCFVTQGKKKTFCAATSKKDRILSKIFKSLFLVIIMIKSLHREIILNIDWQNSAEGKCRSLLLKVSRKQQYVSMCAEFVAYTKWYFRVATQRECFFETYLNGFCVFTVPGTVIWSIQKPETKAKG